MTKFQFLKNQISFSVFFEYIFTIFFCKTFQGDGDSAPDTPPNEEDDEPEVATKPEVVTKPEVATPSNPFDVEVKVDLMAVALLLVSFATRMIYLDQPKNVV